MLATLTSKPFDDRDWIFETKRDGFRLIAKVDHRALTLCSRNGLDVTKRYSVLIPALRKIRRSAVIDGKLVALDKNEHSCFEMLQNVQRANVNLGMYIGHSGGGFRQEAHRTLYAQMARLKTSEKPFDTAIAHERTVTWIKPKLVCEVRFTEWTQDGLMRHPVYLGLRDDKPAHKVTREIPL